MARWVHTAGGQSDPDGGNGGGVRGPGEVQAAVLPVPEGDDPLKDVEEWVPPPQATLYDDVPDEAAVLAKPSPRRKVRRARKAVAGGWMGLGLTVPLLTRGCQA